MEEQKDEEKRALIVNCFFAVSIIKGHDVVVSKNPMPPPLEVL